MFKHVSEYMAFSDTVYRHNYLCIYELWVWISTCVFVCLYIISFLYELILNIKVEFKHWQTSKTKMHINSVMSVELSRNPFNYKPTTE